MSHVGAKPDAPTTLRVYPGAPGSFSLYQDAGTGTGYQHGQYSLTSISTRSSHGRVTHIAIGPADGRYSGQPSTRSFVVKLERVTSPDQVHVSGAGDSTAWSYDPATHRLTIPVDGLRRSDSAGITVIGAQPISSPEPAAVDLSIDPSTPLSLPAGGSTTVKTAEHNAGPGSANDLQVGLAAPSGWTVKPASPVSGGDLADGSTSSQSWTVTAPAGGSSPVTGALTAGLTYVSAGRSETVTAEQQAPPAPAPLPPPVITSASPSSTPPGTAVTLTGTSFGASQGSSYLTLAQGGTSWGAPFDGAKLTITNWSDTSITFQLPPNSGPFPLKPGSATVTVTVSGQSSNAEPLTITP
jgi:hypothetical protein